jgi:hypothetical protein
MAFVVVEFANNLTNDDEDNEVGIVSNKWFTDPTRKEIYWPPVKSQDKYEKLLKRMELPTNEWMVCPVKKLFYETGKQYDLNICMKG